jgi:hypothetical protein
MPSDCGDGTAASTSPNVNGARKGSALDVLSARPPKLPKLSKLGALALAPRAREDPPLHFHMALPTLRTGGQLEREVF